MVNQINLTGHARGRVAQPRSVTGHEGGAAAVLALRRSGYIAEVLCPCLFPLRIQSITLSSNRS